jgi:hypothetical protein
MQANYNIVAHKIATDISVKLLHGYILLPLPMEKTKTATVYNMGAHTLQPTWVVDYYMPASDNMFFLHFFG